MANAKPWSSRGSLGDRGIAGREAPPGWGFLARLGFLGMTRKVERRRKREPHPCTRPFAPNKANVACGTSDAIHRNAKLAILCDHVDHRRAGEERVRFVRPGR